MTSKLYFVAVETEPFLTKAKKKKKKQKKKKKKKNMALSRSALWYYAIVRFCLSHDF